MAQYFKVEPLIPAKLIKVNNLKEISNPVFFNGNGSPTSDGLLSNEIFGITKDERAGTFAYISLGKEIFLHPLHYKIWSRMDSKIKEIVYGIKTFRINSKGEFEEDKKGETGIKFLRKNIDKIKIRATESAKRDRNIKFLMENKDTMFIEEMIIIPAFYRDVNTENGKMGVGDINKLYNSLLIAVRSLNESSDYGLNISDGTRGRIQEIILQIYSWFADGGESNSALDGGVGIAKKKGILRRANLSKTTDFSSRLVLSAPNLKVENFEDMQVDFDKSALPLASALTNFYPFIIFWVRSFFENEFSANKQYTTMYKGKPTQVTVRDYQIEFSDTRIKKEMDRFIHGFSNRFIPIEIPNKENIKTFMQFKGRSIDPKKINIDDIDKFPIMERDLTWCDLFFLAATEMTKDKHVLITRYPIDSYYNQFPTKITITSTKDTEPMILQGVGAGFYKNYPKIRQEDINTDTSNKFIDTLSICNAYLKSIGGDYDGDQVTVKGIFTKEANIELEKQLNSKAHYISLDGINLMKSHDEGVQVLYNLTLILTDDEEKLSDPVF